MAAVLEAFLKNEAIRTNFAKLVRGMETDRVNIANQCYAKGLMPQVMLNATPTDMLNAIQGQVAADGTGNIFQSFCDILEEENSTAYLAQNLLKSLQLLKTRERYRTKKKCKKATNPHLDSTLFPIKPPSFKTEEDHTKLEEFQEDITSDITSDEDEEEENTSDEDDDENEDKDEIVPKIGAIESVTHPDFDSNYQTNRRYKCTSISPQRPSFASLPTSPVRKRMESLSIDRSPDRKCCRHRMEINKLVQEKNDIEHKFKEGLFREREKHKQKIKLIKWERKLHTRNLKHKMRHLRLWLKESEDREEQLHQKMHYMDLYYEEIKGYNSQLQLRLQVEQERYAKSQDQKDRLKEKVSALESLMTVSQEDCHRHCMAEIKLRIRVRELEEKISKLEPKSGRDNASIETSDHIDHPDASLKYSPNYSSGHSSSHTSHHSTPLATPPVSPPSQSPNQSTSWSPNHSSSHTPNRSSSSSSNSSSHSSNHSPSHSPPSALPTIPSATSETYTDLNIST